jgi:hypothetical protein
MAETSEIKLQALTDLSIKPITQKLRHWWLLRSEEHFLRCAEVEYERAREAEQNEAYYQKRAAMARSERG